MKKIASLSCFLLTVALLPLRFAWAQNGADDVLRVISSNINAESENAEMCLGFDKSLAMTSPSRLAANLRLEEDGKLTTPQNIAATASSLCIFPLDRGRPYQVTVNGLHGVQGEKLIAAYTLSFIVPDRPPLLAFTGINGGVNGFGAYESPITLRAINVLHANLEVYRVTDIPTMGRIWQDRAQTTLAPSESAHLARSKGQLAWKNETHFGAAANVTTEQSIALRDKLPELSPGLYLIIADASDNEDHPTNKSFAPLAAAWFTKSDFTLRAVRDDKGIHVFAATTSAAKSNIRLIGLNKKAEQVSEAHTDDTGLGILPLTPETSDTATVIGIDEAGNIAFADVEPLPTLRTLPTLGSISVDAPYTTPGGSAGVVLALTGDNAANPTSSLLRITRDQAPYADISVSSLTKNSAKLSFSAPAVLGLWNLHWQKNDDLVLADAPLFVTVNTDAPHLDMSTNVDALSGQSSPEIDVRSLTSGGKSAPLIDGHLLLAWQRRDTVASAWKDYQFGTQAAIVNAPMQSGDFLTDLQGTTRIHPALPKPPSEPGLYQASLTAVAETDQGVVPAPPLVLPLRPDNFVVGIKPLSLDAHFTQNSLARFALIALSSEENPRDLSGLSYQVYEEGRSFDWYQDEGKWNYKRDPQLRPIGGGTMAIKSDGSSILEWPVDAGNYRLEILDPSGKVLAQMPFSAGWDSVNAATRSTPLSVMLPKILHPGHEAVARFTLPAPAMVTAIIADGQIRKTIHEFYPKGENTITFTPADDWQNAISLTIEATAALPEQAPLSLRAVTQAALEYSVKPVTSDGDYGASLFTTDVALSSREGNDIALNVGLENRSHTTEVYDYVFTPSPGLKIEGEISGHLTLGDRQMRTVPVSVSSDQLGVKELKIDVTSAHGIRISHTWPVAILGPSTFLKSMEVGAMLPQQSLASPNLRTRGTSGATIAFIARRSMEGLGEILSYVFEAHPFTTTELAMGVDALRVWQDTIAQSGQAPDFVVAAQRQAWLMQLLQRQNPDGGFARLRDSTSTVDDTATALLALGPDNSDKVHFAKDLAVNWLKQRLANTWFDEKERASRAAAYAALAAANAIDSASLHYFSDTSATVPLPAIAEANIAAAFKHIHDPNAAAFWIKRMLDENGQSRALPLLNALAATDALSSDDVHTTLRDMADAMRHGKAPNFTDAAMLLRAAAADNVNAGTWRLAGGNQTRDVLGVYTVRLSDASAATVRNGGGQPLIVSFATEGKTPPLELASGASIVRHIYRLNGVELAPQTKPVRGEIYIIELTGKTPAAQPGEQILIHDSSGPSLRPMGCMLSTRLDTLSFIPWFTSRDLSSVGTCEMQAHEINGVLAFAENENRLFRVVYFAHIDARSTAELAYPRLRVIQQ